MPKSTYSYTGYRCIREDDHAGTHQSWSDDHERLQWIDPLDERIWVSLPTHVTKDVTSSQKHNETKEESED